MFKLSRHKDRLKIVPSPYEKSLGIKDRYILFDPVTNKYGARWNPLDVGPDWSLEELTRQGFGFYE